MNGSFEWVLTNTIGSDILVGDECWSDKIYHRWTKWFIYLLKWMEFWAGWLLKWRKLVSFWARSRYGSCDRSSSWGQDHTQARLPCPCPHSSPPLPPQCTPSPLSAASTAFPSPACTRSSAYPQTHNRTVCRSVKNPSPDSSYPASRRSTRWSVISFMASGWTNLGRASTLASRVTSCWLTSILSSSTSQYSPRSILCFIAIWRRWYPSGGWFQLLSWLLPCWKTCRLLRLKTSGSARCTTTRCNGRSCGRNLCWLRMWTRFSPWIVLCSGLNVMRLILEACSTASLSLWP